MRQTLREYKLVSTQADRAAGVYPKISSSGDFFMLRAVYKDNGTFPTLGDATYDMACTFQFTDDQGEITCRAGEGGKRNYDSVTVRPSILDATVNGKYIIVVVAGFGELNNVREELPVPRKAVFQHLTVPANDSLLLVTDSRDIKEFRLHIPITETSGLWIGGVDAPFAAGESVWLEKGVVEWFDFSGNIYAENTTGSDIEISVMKILRNDF